MVLSAGAVLQFPNKNRIIIDAGTCVTYDFVDENNIYYGGAISPGIRLRYEAMHNYTAKLPLLNKEEPENIIGSSTEQSMHSGVINGLAFEIDGYISTLTFQKENFIIILTGGDAIFLAKRLKNTIFANSNFLLESLNSFTSISKSTMIKKIILGSLFLFSITNNSVKNLLLLPYSYYGIGEIKFKGTVDTIDLWEAIGILNDSIHINLQNPAALSSLKLTTFTAAGTFSPT